MKSYKDPVYDQFEREIESKLQLPPGVLRSLRVNGEKTNADRVSSSGARTVYQFIPSTRDAIFKKTGVDAYASPRDAAHAAGYLIKDNLDRNKGDIEQAVGEYHAGPNRKQWGPVNRAYRERVMAGLAGQPSPPLLAAANNPVEPAVASVQPPLAAPDLLPPPAAPIDAVNDLIPDIAAFSQEQEKPRQVAQARRQGPQLLPDGFAEVPQVDMADAAYKSALDKLRRNVAAMWSKV